MKIRPAAPSGFEPSKLVAMTERTLLPIRLPSASRLSLPQMFRGKKPEISTSVGLFLRCMSDSGIEGISILGRAAGAWPSAPALVVIHESAGPEVRARFLDQLAARGLSGQGCLCLTPAEWGIWSRSSDSLGLDLGRPLWGAPQRASASVDQSASRIARLRTCSGLFWTAFHRALAAGGATVLSLGEELRDRLEQEVSPTTFPPRWLPDADLKVIHASVLGALHTTFAGEVAVDPVPLCDEPMPGGGQGDNLAVPYRTVAAVEELVATLLADLPSHFIGSEVLALYLLPGPVGSRLSWSLVAVVPDSAALERCADLRFRLTQHLRLLDRRAAQAVFEGNGGVVVVPSGSVAGMLRRRLFSSPSRRVTVGRHRILLLGEDVLSEGLVGPETGVGDAAQDLACVIQELQSLWAKPSRACDVHDLFYGRLPALIHWARTGAIGAPLSVAHSLLAESVDPAQAFAGKEGQRETWCHPSTADLGRAKEFLRDRGPMVLRLQEVAVEAVLAAESEDSSLV